MNPMEILVQAASALNPKQFELPRSMSVPCMFPGRDKSKFLVAFLVAGNATEGA